MLSYFLIPYLAIINRKWRGEGEVKRWIFYTYLVCLPLAATGNYYFSAAFLLYCLGLFLPPNNWLLCVITNNAPSRLDGRKWSFLHSISDRIAPQDNCSYRRYGVIYGNVSGLCVIPGLIALAFTCPNWLIFNGCFPFIKGSFLNVFRRARETFNPTGNPDNALKYLDWYIGAILACYVIILSHIVA